MTCCLYLIVCSQSVIVIRQQIHFHRLYSFIELLLLFVFGKLAMFLSFFLSVYMVCVFFCFIFMRHAMHKRGFAVARCPSVRLSVAFVYCIQTAEDIVKLLCRPSSPIILVF